MTHADTNDTTPQIRTPEEIDQLKREWLSDPQWDIEDTWGFEVHRDELLAYHNKIRAKEEAENKRQAEIETKRIQQMANGFGCSFQIAEILDRLDREVRTLRRSIGQYSDPDTVVYRLQRLEGRV